MDPRRLLGITLLALSTVGAGPNPATSPAPAPAPAPTPARKIEPKADRLLKEMSDRLASLKRFEIVTHNTIEAVTKDGRKLEFESDSKTTVERPNRLKSRRIGELAQVELYYDGQTMTVFSPGKNYYASAAAPPTLDAAIESAREKLDIELPLADLLASNPYESLLENVERGEYVSEGTIDGAPCHHLSFVESDVDWQIWIDEQTKLPRKYVLVSKNIKGAPEYSVMVQSWNLDPPKVDFTFRPPPGAQRIEFMKPARPAG
jgi:hypothetical protein